ncbi:MAG: InlB B-repeat-containing protein, partial [Acutalibacteraceae bacterium]
MENEITTTMSGYSTTYADKIITWTCKYIDKGSGKEMTATAYTRCVAVPCASAGSTVISASSQAGYESTWHDDTKIGVTGWIVGATSVDARKYTISSASSGTEDNGIVGDGRGGYKNNYLESPSTVTTNGRDNISNLYNESYNGGSGFYKDDASAQWPTGGKGTLYIDSSRYTSLGQIPQLYVGIDCNYRYQKSADMILYYDWYSKCNSTYPTTYTAASQSGVSTGSTQRGIKLSSATFPLKTTTTDTLVLHAWSKSYGNSSRTGDATCYLVCQFRDKTILREAYELMIKNSTYLQQAYFTDSAWSTFKTYRSYIYDYLLNPNSTATQADLNTYGKNLYNQVSKMVACVKADGGSATATYTTYGTTSTTSVTRSDVLKTGTATVYHRYVTGGSGESITSSATIGADETYTYYYGENVITGFSDFSSSPDRGYVKYGYAPGNWSSGSLTLGTGNNTNTFVETSSLEYTYVYLKNSLVNFNANGGSCSTANKTVTYSDIYGDLPTPTKAGYTFNGWFTETIGGSQVTASTTAWLLSDQTLYAQWTPKIYTVNFDPNGGSCGTASKIVTYDSTYGALPTPTRTNYSFSGWFTSTIGGSQVTPSTVVKNAGNQTLYAQWIANSYTVTFNANGGECDTPTKSVSYDSIYGTLPTPTRTGYSFNGWYTAVSG